jgi:hypothetical protein
MVILAVFALAHPGVTAANNKEHTNMLKYLLSTALLIGMTATAFSGQPIEPLIGKTVTYTFADVSGSPYCDGIRLTQTGVLAVGLHLQRGCRASNTNAGGFAVKISTVSRNTLWDVTTTDSGTSASSEVVLLDEVTLTWQLWVQSDSGRSGTFHETNYGTLLTGYRVRRGHDQIPAIVGRL